MDATSKKLLRCAKLCLYRSHIGPTSRLHDDAHGACLYEGVRLLKERPDAPVEHIIRRMFNGVRGVIRQERRQFVRDTLRHRDSVVSGPAPGCLDEYLVLLPVQHRQLMQLVYGDGLSLVEVSRRTGERCEQVGIRHREAKELLRSRLQPVA